MARSSSGATADDSHGHAGGAPGGTGPGRGWRRAALFAGLTALAIAGLIAGCLALVRHASSDPLVDATAYYDAAGRLNAGEPLYIQSADTDEASFYRYPPLLAIAFRPLATLPYAQAAVVWEAILVAAFAFTLLRIGVRPSTAFAIAVLALPIAWALSIGQAQVLVTLLLAIGSPSSVALAANLKIVPAIAAIYWVGRRDWKALRRFVGWMAVLAVVQVILEPAGSLAFLGFSSLAQVGAVINLSPYAVSPVLWAALLVAGAVVAFALAPTRYGWAAAVTLSVLSPPRLLSYMLSSLLAAFGGPRHEVSAPEAPLLESRQ